jgi:glyoxylase-like metal-dependent hydrolase (beta-lactamase superfamily II)
VVDLPYLRARAPDRRLTLEFDEHLGAAERIAAPTLQVTDWLRSGSRIDLGGREIVVLHTPGHTVDSVTLVDAEGKYVFAGDFLTPGPLAEFGPLSGMGDYLQGVETLLRAAPSDARVFGAHPDLLEVLGPSPPGAPELPMGAVHDLHAALLGIREGTLRGGGVYPVIYPVDERLELWANPPWLQDWEPRHPTGGQGISRRTESSRRSFAIRCRSRSSSTSGSAFSATPPP